MPFEDLGPSLYDGAKTMYTIEDMKRCFEKDFDSLLKQSKKYAEIILSNLSEYDFKNDKETLEQIREYGILGFCLRPMHDHSFHLVWKGYNKEDDGGWKFHSYLASGSGGYCGMWTMTPEGRWVEHEFDNEGSEELWKEKS